MRSIMKIATALPLANRIEKQLLVFEERQGVLGMSLAGTTRRLFNDCKNSAEFADGMVSVGKREMEYLIHRELALSVTKIGTLNLHAFVSPILRTAVKSLNDLVKPTIKKIALSHPDRVESGFYFRRACKEEGIWEQIKPKVMIVENDQMALGLAETYECSMAIAWESEESPLKRSPTLYETPCYVAVRKGAPMAGVALDFAKSWDEDGCKEERRTDGCG